MVHIVVFSSIQAAVCGYALWRGGAPERWTALLMAVAYIATWSVPFEVGVSFHRLNRLIFGIDLLMLFALGAIALRANRFWPLWIAAVQLVAIGIHLVKAYDPLLVSWIYNAASGKIAYPMVAMLAVGTWRHHARRRRYGIDPDWSPSQSGPAT